MVNATAPQGMPRKVRESWLAKRQFECVVDARWVLTWKMVDCRGDAEARSVAEGYQDPDLKEGIVETSGCVSLPSFNFQVISLGVLENWSIWSLDNKDASLRSDGFGRDVFFCAVFGDCMRRRIV